jgi:hypothetical protein
MALLQNNVRRRLSYLYFMKRYLKLFCSTKITPIHTTITLEDKPLMTNLAAILSGIPETLQKL